MRISYQYTKLIIVFLLGVTTRIECFDTLCQALEYARQVPEYTQAGLLNYTQKRQSLLSTMIDKFRPTHTQLWSVQSFYKLLTDVTDILRHNKKCTVNIPIEQNLTVIVWGSLHGSFHSLARSLSELRRQGIINGYFKIQTPATYCVINGDMFDERGYSLELFTLVLAFIKANPTTVIYIQGKNESHNGWKNTSLRHELRHKTQKGAGEKIPLSSAINSFFAVLPQEVLITSAMPDHGYARIAYAQESVAEIYNNSNSFGFMRVFIKGQADSFVMKNIRDLRLDEQEAGATTWYINSGTQHDAFCMLRFYEKLEQAIITVYTRALGESGKQVQQKHYSLLLGTRLQKQEPVCTIRQDLRFCSTLDLSKRVRGVSIPMKTGIALKINEQNQAGGLDKHRVAVVFKDDAYLPQRTREHILHCLEYDKTPWVLCPVGGPTLGAFLDLIEKKQVFVLFAQNGSPLLRKPNLTNIVHFRASFFDEARELTEYMLEQYKPKTMAVIYQNDEFGMSIIEGARQVLKKHQAIKMHEITYDAYQTDFKPVAEKIRVLNPDVIGFFTTGPTVLQIIRALDVGFLANKQFYAMSSVGDALTLAVLKDKGIMLTLACLVPNPQTSDLAIVKEYRALLERFGYAPQNAEVFSLEGYIVTSIALDLFDKLQGCYTQQALLKLIESIKNYNFKGLTLNFDPQTRSLAHYLWIKTSTGAWLERKF